MSKDAFESWVLQTQCANRAGVLAGITGYLHQRGASFQDVSSYGDLSTDRFFSRMSFGAADQVIDIAQLEAEFASYAEEKAITWSLRPTSRKLPAVIAVSKFGHCLNDLLYRWRTGELPIDIKGVISNHDSMRGLVEWHGLRYHYLPASPADKSIQERQILDVLKASGSELLILARYMQILSDALAQDLSGSCINIHHSFLPSFKGARPYHQAHTRGVKLIGATAHYVTADLDEGPIIEQGLERVDHAATAEQMVTIGQDTESNVLARAVKWHAEGRVFLNGHRTVVLR